MVANAAILFGPAPRQDAYEFWHLACVVTVGHRGLLSCARAMPVVDVR